MEGTSEHDPMTLTLVLQSLFTLRWKIIIQKLYEMRLVHFVSFAGYMRANVGT